jgi:hypothetical protein
MFVRLEHIPSGTVIFDGPCLDYDTIEDLTDALVDQLFYGEIFRAPAEGHIHSGCADYRTEVRGTPVTTSARI